VGLEQVNFGSQITGLAVPDAVHKYRLEVCEKCPLVAGKKEGKTIAVDGHEETMRGAQCTDCGCFVYLKGRLKDYGCSVGKW
jgi:hypothetical protein